MDFDKLDVVPELHDKVKSIVKDAFSKIADKFALFSITHDAVESRSRDGYFSQNDGGAFSAGYTTVQSITNDGPLSDLPEAAQEGVRKFEKACLDVAKDLFKAEYRSELEELNLSDEDLNSLEERGHKELSEALSNLESENTSDNESTIRFVLSCHIARKERQSNDRTMYVDVVVNWEAPYHRAGKNNEWYIQESFDFSDEESMLSQLQAKVNQYVYTITK